MEKKENAKNKAIEHQQHTAKTYNMFKIGYHTTKIGIVVPVQSTITENVSYILDHDKNHILQQGTPQGV